MKITDETLALLPGFDFAHQRGLTVYDYLKCAQDHYIAITGLTEGLPANAKTELHNYFLGTEEKLPAGTEEKLPAGTEEKLPTVVDEEVKIGIEDEEVKKQKKKK
jgi:hypothetical protein